MLAASRSAASFSSAAFSLNRISTTLRGSEGGGGGEEEPGAANAGATERARSARGPARMAP